MKKPLLLLIAVAAMAFAGTATAALVPGVYDPGSTGCPVATYAAGVLHLEKNCADADGGCCRSRHHRPRGTDVHFRNVHSGERRAVPRRITPLQHLHDDQHVLPRLQQRDADDERRTER